MKKTLLYIATVMTATCGFANTLRVGGSFLNGVWRNGEANSFVSPKTATLNASANRVTFTASPEAGYRVLDWHYKAMSSQPSASENMSTWQSLNADGADKTTCTVAYQSPFSEIQTCWIAANFGYVKFGLSFNYNGGSGSVASMSNLSITNNIVLPAPESRAGYEFVSWKSENDATFQEGVTIDNILDLGIGNADTNFTLTAQWTPHAMSVSYNLDGGSFGTDHPAAATYGETFKVSAPTKTGYEFKGWMVQGYDTYTARYGTNSSTQPSTSLSDGYACPPGGGDVWFLNLTPVADGAIALTATWQAKTYTVNFSVSGANNNPTTSMTVTYGEPLPNVTTTPSYDNADFFGFYTAEFGQGEQYWYSDGKPAKPAWSNDVDNMTFYECKGNIRRLLRFNGNGGIPAQTVTNAVVGATYGSVMPSVSWSGGRYDFAGWFTDPSDGDEVADTDLVTDGSGDITLYAHWEAAKYYVRFDGNGATNAEEMAVQQIPFDAATPLSLNEYGKTGYAFTEWTNSAAIHFADGATVSNLVDVAGSTCTVHAVWSPNEYCISFDPNGGAGAAFVWTNRYDTATNCPPADTFTRAGFWKFSCWSNTLDGTTYEPGDALLNLTAEPNGTVVVDAVWETTLSRLSLAMHCDNVSWENQSLEGYETPPSEWTAEWGAELGYGSSGSQVCQNGRSVRGLQAAVLKIIPGHANGAGRHFRGHF